MAEPVTSSVAEELTTPVLKTPTSHSSDPEDINMAIIAGVIAVVFITLLTVLVLIIVYLYKHKGSYVTNEQPDEANKALQMESNSVPEDKQEYYM
ncbi:small cell adhesion glycoprotein isoform X1 [Rhinatrema bivittatum]|uniref:small cell adhesion glycoprotein isoform X1 n=1 Tax=Rhinatrema bivittatum TaxID=194408 RepID=UPI00112DDDE0|nr:small cell adhesion glycoprotein isoform X1 [Rhinatrema bivittatum]XP_029450818.1 small cell adhesion glycoprotein isoform X1 [Rhinatrema bivittatum]XP_029450819.1 small cell adhesion glycoprotein isoform X1 [Rhinatrema bivittatum]XP_029450820.1 small cell adhesion glycoprotein isoform X1 [Rhinatrema bivittatum]